MQVSRRGGEQRGSEGNRGGSKTERGREAEREEVKLRSVNGNRLGNYSVVTALCGEEEE